AASVAAARRAPVAPVAAPRAVDLPALALVARVLAALAPVLPVQVAPAGARAARARRLPSRSCIRLPRAVDASVERRRLRARRSCSAATASSSLPKGKPTFAPAPRTR